jgi:hypothetical protein
MRARFALLLVLAALLGGCGESDEGGASEKSGGPEATKTPDSEGSGPGGY